MKNVLKTKEWFKHRKDKLDLRCYDHTTGKIVEEFSPGRIGSNIGKMQALKGLLVYLNYIFRLHFTKVIICLENSPC